MITPTKSLQLSCGMCVLLLGLAVRLPHLNQSLWYDEMTTLGDYVLQPWSKVLAAGAGEYVPNNHVLHTVLVKLIYPAADPLVDPPREVLLRIPALLAGLLVPVALVWPLRTKHPVMALMLGIIGSMHPWLVADSCEARGYSLMLLLGILATNCLPIEQSGWPIRYVIFLTLAIYTVPLAVMLIPGHAVAVWVSRRSAFLKWALAATMAILLAGLLYLPMASGLISYYKHPFAPTLDYRQFLDALPRYALVGMRLPMHTDAEWAGRESIFAAAYWAVPVIVIVLGSVLGWTRQSLRPLLITMGVTSLLGIMLPLVTSGTTEPRFDQWMLPWFCLSAVGLLGAARSRFAKSMAAAGFTLLVGCMVVADVKMPPNQPIREGMKLADQLAPPGRDILVLYGGAAESAGLYHDQVRHHKLLAALNTAQMLRMQDLAIGETGHLPWVVIIYERMAFTRDLPGNEEHGLWRTLMANYHLASPRLPGRVAPVAIYEPNEHDQREP